MATNNINSQMNTFSESEKQTLDDCCTHASFGKKLALNIDTDRKSFYAYVRNRSKSKSSLDPLVDDSGTTSVFPQDLVDKFNQYFASVFTVENISNIPTVDNVFHGSQAEEVSDIQIDEAMIRKGLDRLRPDKAAGVDDLSPRLLLELKDKICYPLTKIMQQSHNSGLVPEDWKSANVTPIFNNNKHTRMFPGCRRVGSLTEAVENARYFIFINIKLEQTDH